VAALLFKNACVACTDPFYPGFVDAVKMSGNKPFFIDGEHWLESLESLNPGSLFYLSADFANPTGKRLTLSERQRLIEIARRRDFYIFDDATYRPFYLDAALPSLVSLAPERVFHALSFSKLLSPGLRIAMTHVPDTMLAAFAALKANISLNSSGFTQAIVGGWLFQNGFSLSAHLAEFKEKMNNKKQFLQNQGLDYEGGFFAAMEIKGRILDFEWCSKLLEIEGVAVCPMNLFSDTSLFNHKIRIAVAKTSEKNLEEGFMKIHKFAQS
jgi:DNA-binding transcriptional MocR family regulator